MIMTIYDIKKLIASDESRTLELKKNYRRVEGRYALGMRLLEHRRRSVDFWRSSKVIEDNRARSNRQDVAGDWGQ